jgi:hypothetical protein
MRADIDPVVGEATIFEHPTLGNYVMVCDKCGQPLVEGQTCMSGFHVKPTFAQEDVGHPVRSTELVLGLTQRLELLRRIMRREIGGYGLHQALAQVFQMDDDQVVSALAREYAE